MNRSFWLLALALMTVSLSMAEQFSYQFTLPTNLVTLGTATVNGTTLQLTPAATTKSGLAYYPTQVSANLGFSTNFTWVPDTCDSGYGGGDGFSFFLTKDAPTSAEVAQSPGNFLGVGKVPNTFMVGYSAYLGKLLICDWTTPLTDVFAYSPQCTSVNVGRILCGASMTVKIFFTGTTLTVYNSSTLLATYAKTFSTDQYFVGLSGSTGNAYFRQSITQWFYSSTTATYSEYAPITDSSLSLLGYATVTGTTLRLTTTSTPAGAAVLSNVKIGFGMNSRFNWTPSSCDSSYNGADGFSFFASKTAPTTAEVVASTGGGLGVQNIPNTVMAAYSATFNEFYICNWTAPLTNTLRYVCYTVANPNPKYTCGASYLIEVSYTLDNKLSMSVNGQVQIASTNVIVDNSNYFVGLSGSIGQGYFQQDVTNWSIKTTNVQTNLAIPTNYVPVGSVVSTSPVLVLTNSTQQTSAAYAKDTQFYISYKFQSSFTWTGNCSSAPATGFSHYFSRFAPTLAQVQASPAEKLGITNVPDVYMMSYDARGRILSICDWGTAPNTWNSYVCSRFIMPNYVCGTPINFTLSYDSFTLKAFVNGVLTLSRSVTIYPRFYYGGFSASTDSHYMTQTITNWRFVGYYPQPDGDFSYGFGLAGTNPILRGSAQVNGAVLTLTNGFSSVENAGLMIHPQPVKMNYGFIANFNWNASNCDSDYNGGDGFAFVFTKSIPTNGSVLTSSGTGLGIQQVPDVTMIGYSSYYNEFYVCSWSSPLTSFRTNPACQTISNSVVNPVHPQRYTCNEPLVFGLNYDGYSFRLSQISTTTEVPIFTTSLPLDFSSSYYVGLSASIGDGYYQQDSTYIYYVPLV